MGSRRASESRKSQNRVDMEGNSDDAGEFQVVYDQPQQQETAAAAEEGTVSIHNDCTIATTSTILPWPALLIPSTTMPTPPPPSSSFYHDLYGARRPFQFAYDRGGPSSSSAADPLGLAALYNCSSNYLGSAGGRPGMLMSSVAAAPFEMGKMTAQEIMDAKALAASKSHSEAERRRRERINAHLARLRSLLPSTTKTDKASLLAEVIQHVKELKRQTSEIAVESSLPTETDDLTVVSADAVEASGSAQSLVRASLCCDDRADLLPDLIKSLKALKLRSLKADITTLAGRIKIVLLIAHDDDDDSDDHHLQLPSLATIQDALKAVMERAATPASAASSSAADDSSATISKRQRTATSAAAGLPSILEHRSV